MNVQEKICAILVELSGKEEVKPTDSLRMDLSLDSLSMVTFLLEIEEVFHIQLDESDMSPFRLNLVKDAISMVNGYVAEAGEQNEKES